MPSSASSCGRGLAPERRALEAAVAEQADERDALHLVLLRERGLLVDVDLHDLVGALAHRRDLLDDRSDLAARSAPRRPEVDDHRHVGAEHLGGEAGGGHRLHQALGRAARAAAPTGRSPAGPRPATAWACCTLSSATSWPIGYSANTTGTPRLDEGLGQLAGRGRPGSSGRRCRAGAGRRRRGRPRGRCLEQAGRRRTGSSPARRRGGPGRCGPSAERQRQTGALREAADDGLRPRHAVLVAGGVEQVVDRGERRGEPVGHGLGSAAPAAMSYQEKPGGAAIGPRGSTATKWPSGSR